MIKAIIVDDEPPAPREMKRLLAEHGDVNVTGEAGDIAVAAGLLLRTRPDVVFLDIQLGKRSGFELLEQIDPETAVVFVTAFDAYAVKAFETSAIDYLVKPVSHDRLTLALERVRDRQSDSRRDTRSASVYSGNRWIFLEGRDHQDFVEIDTITHIEAGEGGTTVYIRDGRVRTTTRSLSYWESRLPAGDFVRVHRSIIVNLRHVEKVEEWFHYSYRLTIAGYKGSLAMSRRYAARLRDLIG
jgi:two-component system LytT family response regulator